MQREYIDINQPLHNHTNMLHNSNRRYRNDLAGMNRVYQSPLCSGLFVFPQKRGYMKPEIKPRLLSVKDAAAELGLSIWTLRAWAYSGRIGSHKVGNRLMIAPEEINRIVTESERPRLQDVRQ
jgi:excisionase family DNA binding protein